MLSKAYHIYSPVKSYVLTHLSIKEKESWTKFDIIFSLSD